MIYNKIFVTKEKIIGYKKAFTCKKNRQSGSTYVIITLEIPKGALVYLTHNDGFFGDGKCRASCAKVKKIQSSYYNNRYLSERKNYKFAISGYSPPLKYEQGKLVYSRNINGDKHFCSSNVQCAEGIHFFLKKNYAESYNL